MTPVRVRGAALVVGAALTALLVDTGTVAFHWLPLLLGLTLLGAAAASRSRGPLWAPGLVLLTAGATVGVWFAAGRSGDDYRLVPLVALGPGAGRPVGARPARAGRVALRDGPGGVGAGAARALRRRLAPAYPPGVRPP
ncbi:MAG: hypothetical protein ACLGIG_03705 [Actinomycetes bacterium]